MSPIEHWRLTQNRYQLEGVQCESCAKVYYPQKFLCACGSQKFSSKKLVGRGKILSFTEVFGSSRAFKNMVPYCLALIELEEGPTILTQMTDATLQELSVGQPVRSVFRRYCADGQDGLIYYGLKFVPDFNR